MANNTALRKQSLLDALTDSLGNVTIACKEVLDICFENNKQIQKWD